MSIPEPNRKTNLPDDLSRDTAAQRRSDREILALHKAAEIKELTDYLLSPEYRPPLRRAIATRYGDHPAKHLKALKLLDTAFPT